MSYLQRWRKYNAEACTMAQCSTSESDENVNQQTLPLTIPETENQPTDADLATGTTCSPSLSLFDNENSFSDSYRSSLSSDDSIEENEQLGDSSGNESVIEENDLHLRKNLAGWAARNGHSRASIDELLAILREAGHDLPKDSRTLLRTPRHIECGDLCGGKYLYLGLECGILKIMSQFPNVFENMEEILLNFNIDGVPLFKSSNVQFWPILCSIQGFDPFVVAVFCGTSKPNSIENYLMDFLAEIQTLKQNNIKFGNKIFPVKINAFVCDAPARAFLKCIKGHNAYFSCERCTIKGKWDGRVVFISTGNTAQTLRNEDSFSKFEYKDHQIKETPLIAAGLSCIHSFALDYMHLVCLGVVKRVLTFLKQGPRECKLSQRQISQISDYLLSLNGKMPQEFARQPRSLYEMDKWKATEYRQFMLYTGPLVLRSTLPEKFYNHFLCLTVAMSILLDSNQETRNSYLEYAGELLNYFVQLASQLYTETLVSYNVHALTHIVEDVRHFNTSLNEVCAFQFENFLHKLKKSVRNAKNPVAQVAKRIAEIDSNKAKMTPRRPCISTRKKDSCFLLDNQSFAFVREKKQDSKYLCDIYSMNNLDSFFNVPCDSKLINIAVLNDITVRRHVRQRVMEQETLTRKVVCLPFRNGFVLMPMLHGIERR